jgi:Aromatic-ring-opening dioxygenase LigAB, LigA subunit
MEVGRMSTYAVHKLIKRIQREPCFREQLQRDPEPALHEFSPGLTDQERSALLAGDVGALHALGVHGYLLSRLVPFGLFGLTAQNYPERIRSHS